MSINNSTCQTMLNNNPSAISCITSSNESQCLPSCPKTFKYVVDQVSFILTKRKWKHPLMPNTSHKLMWMKSKPNTSSLQSHTLCMFPDALANSLAMLHFFQNPNILIYLNVFADNNLWSFLSPQLLFFINENIFGKCFHRNFCFIYPRISPQNSRKSSPLVTIFLCSCPPNKGGETNQGGLLVCSLVLPTVADSCQTMQQ